MTDHRTDEVVRIAEALSTAIRLSRVSYRQIERSLGLSSGYLTRILKGQVELRMNHVLNVCEVIGLPPGSFFSALYPAGGSHPIGGALQQLHPGDPDEPGSPLEILSRLRSDLSELEVALATRDPGRQGLPDAGPRTTTADGGEV